MCSVQCAVCQIQFVVYIEQCLGWDLMKPESDIAELSEAICSALIGLLTGVVGKGYQNICSSMRIEINKKLKYVHEY